MVLKQNERQIRWHCHRGMLELDLLLLTFFDKHYATLLPEQQQLFEKLLDFTDPELLAVIMGYEQPLNADFLPLLARIRSACKS